ncbi:MAG: hypothetical protein J7M25_17435 [Deltaproteobacteria bacterium]|nr:hypothetical protein [Deltaproteobacteria bacterium]
MIAGAKILPQASVVLNPGDEPPNADHARRFLLATEYPITTVDATAYQEVTGHSVADSSTAVMSLAVVDALSMAKQDPVVGRAEFFDFRGWIAPLPSIGTSDHMAQYSGILAGDLLRAYAIRLAYQDDPECHLPWSDEQFATISFIQEFSDTSKELGRDGFAVLHIHLSGGGHYLVGGDSRNLGATRIGVGICIEPDPFDLSTIALSDVVDQEDLVSKIPVSGTDAYLLVATGTLPLVLGHNAFQRLKAAGADRSPPETYESTPKMLYQQSEAIEAEATTITRIAVVGNSSDGLGPCGELARSRRTQWIHTYRSEADWTSGAWKLTHGSAAVAEFDGSRDATAGTGRLDVYAVPDESNLLQGIRFEVGADLPQVDGLIGHEFLRRFQMIIDYPGSRLVLRCARYRLPSGQTCDATAVETNGESCCESTGRCLCPMSSPCCQYPAIPKL